MPKDNENIPFLGPVEPLEPQGFSAEQMIRCEECLRANPPTRITCLYCVATLPLTEASAHLRKPVLRQPEKHQLGYNNILLPSQSTTPEETINEVAAFLKLAPESFQQLMSANVPMPVARTANLQEAELVTARLGDLGLNCETVSDEDLGLSFSDNAVKRVKGMTIADNLTVYQAGAGEPNEISWTDLVLIIPARLIETRVEIQERLTRKPEKEIVDASEFFKDELVIDFYSIAHSETWRVYASAFDFSCLGSEKAWVANENIGKLQRVMLDRGANAKLDDSYQRVRNLLELAWGVQQETQSSGWRRDRPGKLSVGVATTKSNESQFTRYSRLRYYLSQR